MPPIRVNNLELETTINQYKQGTVRDSGALVVALRIYIYLRTEGSGSEVRACPPTPIGFVARALVFFVHICRRCAEAPTNADWLALRS